MEKKGGVTMFRHVHRAFGVYGLYVQDGRLLVIHKNGGPYKNRYDLPGGSLEEGESLATAMRREFLEETGLHVEIEQLLGTRDFLVPWLWRDFSHVHHIALFYRVHAIGGALRRPDVFDGQDSLGTTWLTPDEATPDNASPLVLEAFAWLKTATFSIEANAYETWDVLDTPVFAPTGSTEEV